MADACLKVGMYGGAFDPIHNTHLRVAQAATRKLGLEQLIWVPTGNAWHKPGTLTQAHHRIAMLKLAFETLPPEVMQKWRISKLEVDNPAPSYTAQTLSSLQAMYAHARWYVIIGADQLVKLHLWKNWQAIVKHATLAVAGRKGVALDWQAIDPDVRKQVEWIEIPVEVSGDSSTRIRQFAKEAAQGHLPAQEYLEQLLPLPVVHYIQQHHLYE